MSKYRVIIIGAGIGGLTAAAYLSKLGIKSLLIEQSNYLGGRCSTRTIKGKRYEIGAIYLGGGVFDILRDTFGISCRTIPIRCGIKIGKKIASFPLDFKAFRELASCGVSWQELIRLKIKMRTLANPEIFKKYKSLGELFEMLTKNEILRQFFAVLTGVSGASPYSLPSKYINPSHPSLKYKTINPEYLSGGNGELASILYNLTKDKGDLLLNTKVEEILITNGQVKGVRAGEKEYLSDTVISNSGLKQTVLSLTQKENWPNDYYIRVEKAKETLQVVNIFLSFSSLFKLTKNYTVFFVPYNVYKEFEYLEQGKFLDDSMFILHIPSNAEPSIRPDNYRGTLQFYYPRGKISQAVLDRQVKRVIQCGLDKLFDGLSKEVTCYEVYDPIRYENEFGFRPYVFGVSPEINGEVFNSQTPIKGLFCAGDSVTPEVPCVPQAMESGISCAKAVFEMLNIPNNR